MEPEPGDAEVTIWSRWWRRRAWAKIDGIGKALAGKRSPRSSLTGHLEYYEHLREKFPPDIFTLFDLQGLSAKKDQERFMTISAFTH